MSTTINLHPSTQQAIRHALPHHRNSFSPTHPLPEISSNSAAIFPEALLDSLRVLAAASSQFGSQIGKTKIHPSLSLYISDLFSAARHHPQLDAMLLTARARKDVEALVRAARVIGGDLTGIEFIRAMGKGAEDRYVYEEDALANEDLESLSMEWEHLNGNSSIHDVSDMTEKNQQSNSDKHLDVSEADVARIVPRVISHRLRVRDGPDDEILGSLRYGAVRGLSDWDREERNREGGKIIWERDTIKNILVRILGEV